MAVPPVLSPAPDNIHVKPEVLDYADYKKLTAAASSSKPSHPLPARHRRLLKSLSPKPILHVNRRRLNTVLKDLVRAHNWRKASGVLSVLLRGAPSADAAEDRRNFLAAMEVHKRFLGKELYNKFIKQVFEVWMSKLAFTKKGDKKRYEIALELVLFYLTQEDIEAAKDHMRYIVENRGSAKLPRVNLIYGLILYHIWYTHLLKEMNQKGFNISMSPQSYGMTFNDVSGESETPESSNGHNAVDTEDDRFSSQCASESSVGNTTNNLPGKRSDSRMDGFYMSRSQGENDEGVASPNHDINLGSSIFLAHGLDPILLPIRMKQITGDLEQVISTYRKLANENYRDAVKHLRLALCSRQPLVAALLPLIQLLMLGDRVEEALKELENFCDQCDMALPFRLRARLLEVFHNNQTTLISKCYENVLKRDPTCYQSVGALIRMHKTGNYDCLQLLEMIALHLDAVGGSSSIWEEFALCFHRLGAAVSEVEEHISSNGCKHETNVISSRKISNALTGGHTRDSWKIRCKWWASRHFSDTSNHSEMQAGEWQLLTCKAACASHLYGPKFEYVITALRSLRKEEKLGEMAFLMTHIQDSIMLLPQLESQH